MKRRDIIAKYIRTFINSPILNKDVSLVIDLLNSRDTDNLILASYILKKIKGGNIINKIHFIESINKLKE